MRRVAFVVPFQFETSVRFLRAALRLPDVRIGLVSADPFERFAPDVQRHLGGHWRVEDGLDAGQIAAAVRGLEQQLGGPVDCLVGVLEQLQVPLAEARALLGLPGLGIDAANNFRDKARMKDVLRAADVPCARHGLAHSPAEARDVIERIGLPVVVKPPAGAGAVNTFRVDDADQLDQALVRFPPHPNNPMLLEEFVVGREHSFDAACVDGEIVWSSISSYHPTPLDVLHNDWIQWCVLLPRQVDGEEFAPIRRAGEAALRALGMDTGLYHMEWFQRTDGSVAISEVGARPPGAQFTSLMSWAHDTDMYAAWSRLVIHGAFDPPERLYAAGAAYLRGQGRGTRVAAVHGLQQAQRELGSLVVEAKLPQRGQAQASSYEGEGFVIVRHPETEVVAEALGRIVSLVRVELQ